jgi:zinc/manganese transport system permease protein
MQEVSETRGVSRYRVEMAFLVVVALVTTLSVPVVGALLVFSLMIGPPGAARSFTDNPLGALVLSVAIALCIVWIAIAASYLSNWPVGFFVGVLGAASYVTGRCWAGWRQRRAIGPLEVQQSVT